MPGVPLAIGATAYAGVPLTYPGAGDTIVMIRGYEDADGSLPDVQFLHLAAGSDLVDKGVDVGLPFSGSAPDLGAFEYGATAVAGPEAMRPWLHSRSGPGLDYVQFFDVAGRKIRGESVGRSRRVFIRASGPTEGVFSASTVLMVR